MEKRLNVGRKPASMDGTERWLPLLGKKLEARGELESFLAKWEVLTRGASRPTGTLDSRGGGSLARSAVTSPMLRRLLAFAGTLSLLSCAAAQSPAFRIEVEVKSQKGGPVAGAEVSIALPSQPAGSQGARTDDKGLATFQTSSAGDYAIAVHHDSHRSYAGTAKLTAAQPVKRVQAQLAPQPTYGLDVSVVDGSGQSVEGAWVELKGSRVLTATSNAAGRATFEATVPGEYLVQVRRQSFGPYAAAVSLQNATGRTGHTVRLARDSRISLRGEIVLATDQVAPKESLKLALALRLAGGIGKAVEVEQLVELLGPKGAATVVTSGPRTLEPDKPDRQDFVVPCDTVGPHTVRARVKVKDGQEWTDSAEFCVCEPAAHFGGFWFEVFPGGTGKGDIRGSDIVLEQIGNKIVGTYERDRKPPLKIEGKVTGKTAAWTVFDATGKPLIEFYKIVVEKDNRIAGRARSTSGPSWGADLFRDPPMEKYRKMQPAKPQP